MKIVVASDIHLGSWGSNKEKFLKFIMELKTDHLVLNGDVYDLYLDPKDINIFDKVRSNPNIKKLTYVRGNHDHGIKDFFPSEVFVDEILLEDDIVVTHGAQFDTLVSEDYDNDSLIVRVRYWFEKIFKINIKVLINKTFIGKWVSSILVESHSRAVEHYRGKRVILGHTHIPICKHPNYNTGGFVDGIATYVEITYDSSGKGTISLKEV